MNARMFTKVVGVLLAITVSQFAEARSFNCTLDWLNGKVAKLSQVGVPAGVPSLVGKFKISPELFPNNSDALAACEEAAERLRTKTSARFCSLEWSNGNVALLNEFIEGTGRQTSKQIALMRISGSGEEAGFKTAGEALKACKELDAKLEITRNTTNCTYDYRGGSVVKLSQFGGRFDDALIETFNIELYGSPEAAMEACENFSYEK